MAADAENTEEAAPAEAKGADWVGLTGPLSPEDAFERVYQDLRENHEGKLLQEMERAMILRALNECDWNQGKASALLGIARGTLRNRMDQMDLEKDKKPT